MEDNTKPELINLDSCRIDWKNYQTIDENDNPTVEDWTNQREFNLEYHCACDESSPADRIKCFKYYTIDYHLDRYLKYMKQEQITESMVAYWGLVKMLRNGWIKSPAFVDWKDLSMTYSVNSLARLVEHIYNYDLSVKIIDYFIKNAEYLYGKRRKTEFLPSLKALQTKYKEAAKLYKEEQKRLENELKAKNSATKAKPEYTLTIDEIIKYVEVENLDSAPVIRGMLRYFALEKKGWNNSTVTKKIKAIGSDKNTVIEGDYVAGDKHVGTQIGDVQSGGIGAQVQK